jgi:CRISPR-associated protein Cas5d
LPSFCLEVSGDFACFTRPEMKVERVSYDVITPSSVRSIFESILWKPAVRWVPERIEVLTPVRWTSLRRNEVGSKCSARNALYVEDDRQQRAGLFLRDVRYRLHSRLELTESANRQESITKFIEMFERRAEKGQCFNQPYLGCREFACSFELRSATTVLPPPIDESRSLGWMLYDMDFKNAKDPAPRFFSAVIEKGVVRIPEPTSPEIRG